MSAAPRQGRFRNVLAGQAMGIYTILGGQVDILARHPPGLLGEILNWRQRCISSQIIVQQTVSGWSAGLGERES